MRKIIVTITMVLAIISCTPEEKARVIDNSIEPITNNDTNNDEPTPEPEPEPIVDITPFEGEWVVWGYFLESINSVIPNQQGISDTPIITIHEDGSVDIEGVINEWVYSEDEVTTCNPFTLDVIDEFGNNPLTISYRINNTGQCHFDMTGEDEILYVLTDGYILDGVYNDIYFVMTRL